mmetsp:Transcript_81958/g.160757  ORF Transcript_81958/g.160757 Transcript_81958/m.160757 type:complete len:178 (+) Transcript_81958:39-572(+)|eukprot:CAMPEP_0170393004 /NCGR_PEP_ID=MMETSP0117_2-20130122/20490_1 /TAXON_ID=400756 /ORGANISM="Durinskia baltica, Strain CSIRO CS-38" /LENGTH=177 /DNA_ID=CAMNT_0010649171 /DNA_START=31 /DNA_END=564 /DNA_ORIENTATION=+
MSGSGRKSQYRKSVTDSFLNDDYVPTESEKIVKVLGNRGDNTFEVHTETGEKVLARLPKKFNKLIWIKTGDYVVIEMTVTEAVEDEVTPTDREQYSINHILSKPNVKFLKNKSFWPNGLDLEMSNAADNAVSLGSRVARDNRAMPDFLPDEDEEEEGEYEEEEEEVLVDKMGNTISK